MMIRCLVFLAGVALVASACDPSIAPGKAGAGEVGAPCETAADCTRLSSPICLGMGVAGYCASDCAALGQLTCPAGAICDPLGDQAILCMDGCCSQDDCRAGYRCDRRPEIDIYVDLAVCPAPGICILSCTSDAGCGQGEVCDTAGGRCVPRVGVGSGVGAACTDNSQCNSGTCLTGYPGGYCTSACGSQLSECEAGSECYATDGGTPTCMARCTTDAQCRAGYRCEVSATEQSGGSVRAFCVPRCDAAGSCPDGTACDPVSGECTVGAPTAGPIGAFCQDDAQCASGDCNTTWPNGACTAPCGTCDAGAICVDGACQASCGTANDCRFGYVCVAGGCSPGCTADADCDGALVCDTASGLCTSPQVGTTVQEFLTTSVDVRADTAATVNFTVPANALSAVMHLDDGQQTLLAPFQLVGPGDTVLFDLQSPALSRLTFLPTGGTFTGMFPNSPRINLVPGSYRASFIRAEGSSTANLRVFGKVASGFPARQDLEVAFYFVGSPGGLTAATAPTDTQFQQAVSEMTGIYQSLGMDLGTPSYTALSAPQLEVIDTVQGADSELSQVFRLGTRDDTLQFFFVDEILGGDVGFVILGVAGGIPGPPGISGGPHSGVAVTVSGVLDRPNLLGQVMAHEGAHYLGLFHTTEATGTSHDPLPDTVECPASRDASWDGVVSADECASFGSDNFMFWAASGNSRGTSAEQGRVVRRNPLTR